MEQLAHVIDAPLRVELEVGQVEARFISGQEKPDYEQVGDELSMHVQELLGVDEAVGDAIAQWLIDHDWTDVTDGDEPFYGSDQLYVREGSNTWKYHHAWAEFSQRVKHKSRGFDALARACISEILGDPGDQLVYPLPVRELNDIDLFRARLAQTHPEAHKFLQDPSKELAAPPPEIATAGRMNARGISVFYGAFAADTAVAEIRPSVGAGTVVGRFRPTRLLKVLDLSKAPEGWPTSIFHERYRDLRDRREFLATFAGEIARPVQPHEEELEYVPTQVAADYMASVLDLDGIIYPSAQRGGVEMLSPYGGSSTRGARAEDAWLNIALFGSAGAVKQEAERRLLKGEDPPGLAYVGGSAAVFRVESIEVHTARARDWELDPKDSRIVLDF